MARRFTKKPRKPYRRPRKRRRKQVGNYHGVPSGMPKTKFTSLRYATTVNLTSTTGLLNTIVMRANSIYDPEYAVGGTQPMGHDQWEVLFDHYKVLGSKMSVKFITPHGHTSSGIAGTYLSDGFTPPYIGPAQYIEARKGTYRTIMGGGVKPASTLTKFSAKKFFNVSDVKDVGKLGANMGSDPAEQAYFHIWYDDTEGNTSTILCVIVIDYLVSFSEPKDLASS